MVLQFWVVRQQMYGIGQHVIWQQVKGTAAGRGRGLLLEVFAPPLDILLQELLDLCPAFLHGVVGRQAEHGEELQREAQAQQTLVKLLCKVYPHLVARILQRVQ